MPWVSATRTRCGPGLPSGSEPVGSAPSLSTRSRGRVGNDRWKPWRIEGPGRASQGPEEGPASSISLEQWLLAEAALARESIQSWRL